VFWNVFMLKAVLNVVWGGLVYGCFVESFVFCVSLKTAYL
jgi:hypothetical protein